MTTNAEETVGTQPEEQIRSLRRICIAVVLLCILSMAVLYVVQKVYGFDAVNIMPLVICGLFASAALKTRDERGAINKPLEPWTLNLGIFVVLLAGVLPVIRNNIWPNWLSLAISASCIAFVAWRLHD